MSFLQRNKRSIFLLFLLSWLLLPLNVLAGRLAIVIDDIGYRQKEDNAIYALPKEISVAIIPSAPNATARAKQAFEQQRDILIHMPMQPSKPIPIERGALMIGMAEEKIARLVAIAKEKVPYAIGLNNHMGSGATADKQTMRALMKQLAQHQLFFLDSKTIGKSVARQTATEFGISALDRDVFLDSSDQYADVQHQFNLAIQHARKYGIAIMIGHPRKNSIAVLQSGLASLPADIQLVKIGSLWRKEQVMPVKPFILLFDVTPAQTSQPPFKSVPLLRGVPQ